MNNSDYSAVDLAMDEYFQRWVLSNDQEAAQEWKDWLRTHPYQRPLIEEARRLLLLQQYDVHPWPPERRQVVLERIKQSVVISQSEKGYPGGGNPSSPFLRRKWFLFAASIAIILICTVVWQLFGNTYLEYQTSYGETREVPLPDGSRVLLNANSSLQFLDNWQQAGGREVWLEGEAFFEVNPLTSGTGDSIKFTVHLNSLDVEVVGTAFNVNHRKGNVHVFLDHGIVDIRMDDQPRLRLEPGDQIDYSSHTRKLSKKPANAAVIKAWQQHKIILENQPLSDLAEILRNYYGVTIDFSHPKLGDQRVVAVLPSDDLDAVLTTLETLGQVQAERKNNYVLFK